ncbi:MAG: hypothetical protein ABI843_11725 [Dokdonella sp.]
MSIEASIKNAEKSGVHVTKAILIALVKATANKAFPVCSERGQDFVVVKLKSR